MSLIQTLQAIQDSDAAQAFLGSQYVYPAVEAAHVLGLALSVGLLAIVDLRLIGAIMRRQPVGDSLDALRPWMIAGFAAMLVTGAILFWPDAAHLYVNPLFRLKMLFMAAAIANAAVFELRLGRNVAAWADPLSPPTAAKLAGWASLACWAAVILFGRWIAYGFGAPP
jgi:hypothetical protein